MTYETVMLEQREPGIWLLTISRPQALNALTPRVLDELELALHAVEADNSARCLLVTGAGGRAFVAGADIEAMHTMTPLQCRDFSHQGHAVLRALELAPFPVVALVGGYALGGGCELALACDFIVASENAIFGLPEVSLGILPGMGGTQRLSRVVGKAIALELVCGGRQLTADEGQRLGLVNHVVAIDALIDKGLEIARNIARMGPVAVKLAKQVVQRGQDLDLTNANAFETAVRDRRQARGHDGLRRKTAAKILRALALPAVCAIPDNNGRPSAEARKLRESNDVLY